jgi:hypothetical protein
MKSIIDVDVNGTPIYRTIANNYRNLNSLREVLKKELLLYNIDINDKYVNELIELGIVDPTYDKKSLYNLCLDIVSIIYDKERY